MRILLIEDDADFYPSILELLEPRGHKLTVCDEADDAVTEIERLNEYDLIILDLIMRLGTKIKDEDAEETGIAIYRLIRKAHKQIPIIVLSARKKKYIWAPFSADPSVTYVGKPLRSNCTAFIELVEGR